jgi:soluble lytic murein transglycosylase-like protein
MAFAVVVTAAASANAQPATCAVGDLPGLSRQFASLAKASGDMTAGRAAEFSRAASSILGEPLAMGVDGPTPLALPCSPEVRARDRVAAQMAMVGYSAKEIADVLEGRLTVSDLTEAQRRLMAGQSRSEVADFLDARWRELEVAPAPAAINAFNNPLKLPVDLETELELLAVQHHVPTALVRAMVAAESGGNARARSSAGAIGLMQLMPATAAELGVDPWHPLENLRGGIAYMGSLLRAYDENPRLALIAYNAGPQHANRVKAGTAVAYRETRKYLEAIDAMYPLP